MKKYLLSCSIMVSICHSGSVLAMINPFEEDLQSSKTKSLMTNIELKDLKANGMGVMSLCFKTQDAIIPFHKLGYKGYDHASLVFEIFHPTHNPEELTLQMIHWIGPMYCAAFFSGTKIYIDSNRETLPKIYRAEQFKTHGKVELKPDYERYASWVLPKNNLTDALKEVEKDKENPTTLNISNCVGYVQRIMRMAGLTKVDFGCWLTTPDNLRLLVDDYIEPKPAYSKKNNNFPKFTHLENIHINK